MSASRASVCPSTEESDNALNNSKTCILTNLFEESNSVQKMYNTMTKNYTQMYYQYTDTCTTQMYVLSSNMQVFTIAEFSNVFLLWKIYDEVQTNSRVHNCFNASDTVELPQGICQGTEPFLGQSLECVENGREAPVLQETFHPFLVGSSQPVLEP